MELNQLTNCNSMIGSRQNRFFKIAVWIKKYEIYVHKFGFCKANWNTSCWFIILYHLQIILCESGFNYPK